MTSAGGRPETVKKGFTTGSCAAAAAKAAAWMLLGGSRRNRIRIETPAGIGYEPELEDILLEETFASCAVRKEAGDDPDITNHTLIYAKVERQADGRGEVVIEGGEGVGVVTRPGLDQPVGNAAINSVPREMIRKEVGEVVALFDCADSLRVTISVPAGRELAGKTFNPRLGIEGGISIIGTSGIVEPMSTRAILETIRVELRQQRAEGAETVVVSPGNYGRDFLRKAYGYDLERAVKCANFIGNTIDMAGELGFSGLLLAGHVGKLIKLSGGIMNTHSREADCRMELLAAAAVRANASGTAVRSILDCVNTEEAIRYLDREEIREKCFACVVERIEEYTNRRAAPGLRVECMIYANEWGLLGASPQAEEWLRRREQTGGKP